MFFLRTYEQFQTGHNTICALHNSPQPVTLPEGWRSIPVHGSLFSVPLAAIHTSGAVCITFDIDAFAAMNPGMGEDLRQAIYGAITRTMGTNLIDDHDDDEDDDVPYEGQVYYDEHPYHEESVEALVPEEYEPQVFGSQMTDEERNQFNEQIKSLHIFHDANILTNLDLINRDELLDFDILSLLNSFVTNNDDDRTALAHEINQRASKLRRQADILSAMTRLNASWRENLKDLLENLTKCQTWASVIDVKVDIEAEAMVKFTLVSQVMPFGFRQNDDGESGDKFVGDAIFYNIIVIDKDFRIKNGPLSMTNVRPVRYDNFAIHHPHTGSSRDRREISLRDLESVENLISSANYFPPYCWGNAADHCMDALRSGDIAGMMELLRSTLNTINYDAPQQEVYRFFPEY